MAYPDTDLRNDTLDPEYGAQPVNRMGVPAWKWINAVVRLLSQAYLTYVRVPYATVVAVSQSNASPGDVAVVQAESFVPLSSGYYVAKYTAGAPSKRFFGIYLEGVSAGGKARIAVWGVVPPSITTLSPDGAVTYVGIDPANGRLRSAQTGDVIVGEMDLSANFIPTGFGTAL